MVSEEKLISKSEKSEAERGMRKTEEVERCRKKTKHQQAAKTAYADLPGEQL